MIISVVCFWLTCLIFNSVSLIDFFKSFIKNRISQSSFFKKLLLDRENIQSAGVVSIFNSFFQRAQYLQAHLCSMSDLFYSGFSFNLNTSSRMKPATHRAITIIHNMVINFKASIYFHFWCFLWLSLFFFNNFLRVFDWFNSLDPSFGMESISKNKNYFFFQIG